MAPTASAPPIRYTFRQLRYFVAAAETLSFTGAAKQLHVSQPSISSALADLEEAFDAQLFIRHHASGLSLTPYGRDILALARNLLKSAEELQSAMGDTGRGAQGMIALGCLITLAPSLLPGLMGRFKKQHESVSFVTYESHQEELLNRLRDGSLDLVLTYDLDIPEEVLFSPLVDLPPYVILPRNHRYAAARKVSLRSLQKDPYVMLDLPHSREYFSSLFSSLSLAAEPAFRSSQPEVVRGLVANGLGYSLLNFPLRSRTTVDGAQFSVCAIKEPMRPMRLGIARLRSMRPRRAASIFEAFCRSTLPDDVEQAWAAPAGR